MRREWATDDLIAWWTLVDADGDLIANKTGATRLGFALMLKFFELDARFPRIRVRYPWRRCSTSRSRSRWIPGSSPTRVGGYGILSGVSW